MRNRPDPLFVFERLAALEKSLGTQRAGHAAAHPVREPDLARQALLELRRALRSIASLDSLRTRARPGRPATMARNDCGT